MLIDLAIRNFAIIDASRVEFGPGLNVLTGETGAGKSILIDALGVVLGDRTSSDMVRTGARSAAVDATFDIGRSPNREEIVEFLESLEIEPEDGQLILSREIHHGGRSSARLNGRPTTASILSQIGSLIVDVHGQSDHLSLLRPAAQLELLDRFSHAVPLRERYAKTYEALRAARAALSEVLTGARDRMQRIDLLRYQVEEIERASPQPGEEEALNAERARLVNADRLATDAAAAYASLVGSEDAEAIGAALPSLRTAVQVLSEAAQLDPSVTDLAGSLEEVLFGLENLVSDVRDYRDAIEADPARLEAIEERLAALRQLKRKYGATIDDILAHATQAGDELERLTGSEVDAGLLAEREAALAVEVGKLAAELSRQRQAGAERMAREVEQVISQLRMGSAEFSIGFERIEDARGVPVTGESGATVLSAADATGVDRVSFLIAPNAGEALKPLGKIASGGETARLMLALKSILSEEDQTPTLVFDEIDVGVGGRSGQIVGEKLWQLSKNHQVVVITHLPQIAAFADEHFQIAKSERDGRVVSTIAALDDEARLAELAAMLDGLPVSASSLQSASEMVARAGEVKRGSGARSSRRTQTS
jgi:DNA repair protein RecN (Recombination protein N)